MAISAQMIHRAVAGAATRFVSANKRMSYRIERHLPQRQLDIQAAYDQTVATCMATLPRRAVVVDVGAGKESTFARYRKRDAEVRVIGVDRSSDELAENRDVDEKRVADVTLGLPFESGEVDMVVSRSVIEHLRDSESFFREASRVLKPGGYCIHLFTSKFAPFAIANQMLPAKVATKLLDTMHPECRGKLGFESHYDKTYASGMRALLMRNGFDVENVLVSYYQSGYYNFFLPLYVLSAIYELLLQALRAENLAAKIIIVAKKRTIPSVNVNEPA
jgi:ubiquinone/menaquinone biosynthesis C-methylase UbiE